MAKIEISGITNPNAAQIWGKEDKNCNTYARLYFQTFISFLYDDLFRFFGTKFVSH